MILGCFTLGALPVLAQNQTASIQNMVQQYEALTTADRIIFLQRIVMIGFQPPAQAKVLPNAQRPPAGPEITTPPAHPKVQSIEHPEPTPLPQNSIAHDDTKSSEDNLNKTELAALKTGGESVDEPQVIPEADIAIAEPATNMEASLAEPKDIEAHKPGAIRLIADPKISYSFGNKNYVRPSIFSQLLNEYSSKLAEKNNRITEEDLANEALGFYISAVRKDLEGCGFSVDTTAIHEPSKEAVPIVETGISRIVVNKTLFETSVVGEAQASVISKADGAEAPDKLIVIKVGAAQSINSTNGDGGSLDSLKSALGGAIEKLSAQVSEKLCNALQ